MKNDFALDFTPDHVRLIKRSGKNQTLLGKVAYDDPHFGTRIEDLRREAETEHGASAPLSPALLIPASEVLFHSFEIEETDEAKRLEAVRSELEGMTPYTLDDLVYDWKATSKTRVQIAAVARDTLDEADDFAAAHGFGPGRFTSHTDASSFRGEPDFGKSQRPEPTPEPSFMTVLSGVPDADPIVTDEGSDTPSPAPSTEPTDRGKTESIASPPVDQKSAGLPEADMSAVTVTTKSAGIAEKAEAAVSEANGSTGPAPAPAGSASSAANPKPAVPPSSKDAGPTATAGFASRRSVDDAGKPGAEGDATRLAAIASRIAMLPDGGAGPKAGSGMAASSSKPSGTSNGSAASGAATAAGAATSAAAATGAMTPRRGPGPSPQTPTVRRVDPPADGSAGTQPLVGRPKPPLSEAEALTVFGMRQPRQSRMGALVPVLVGLTVALVLALVIWSVFLFLEPSDDVEPVENASLDTLVDEDPVQPQTVDPAPIIVPDAADLTTDEVRPPAPDSDSIDTVIVPEAADVSPAGNELAALSEPEADTAPAADPAPTAIEPLPETAGTSEPIDESVAQEATVEAETDAESAEDQQVAEVSEPDAVEPDPTEPLPGDPLDRPADAPEATRYAATGVSTAAPTSSTDPDTEETGFVAEPLDQSTVAVSPRVASLSAPDLAAFTAPTTLFAPPPPGQRFEFGPDGRIVATPEGALTPQGVRITAGRPSKVPPQTPDRPAGEPVSEPEPTTPSDAEAEAEAATTPETDAALDESDVTVPVTEGRPSSIPPGRPLDEQTAAPVNPDVSRRASGDTPVALGGIARVASPDTLEPRARPEEIEVAVAATTDVRSILQSPRARPIDLAPVAAAPVVVPDAETDAQTAAAIAAILPQAAAAPEPLIAVSPYAVARSLRPGSRPQNFGQIVTRRQESARQAEPVRVATAAAVVTPRNPTAGSVASRATEKNKLRLNQVNLIGVYGTQSNRRALVRLPSGRFIKVKVGDRVDGGQVRAIGADVLQYVKGGRSLTLKMPTG